ncbi:type VII secretion protein EccB [Streptomyces sp. B-S-A8]|uniref:Type VII secretion protein EccB n=1 Tax=Streptomyces solicavernae TaxID=3043614 RepID=A0ABT6RXD8_9ACTN|nr:type VII secretion protein EccB [Streptomyces sp. B-S-A8]MDI3388316.1 type VII secretion protein EccB [Streptomyces sp. B-S-A8]
MAKRRDELAAYTFARKRTVAAFLAPEPGGSEEGAPRPVRTVMPSLAVGVILVIGFIAWGVIKPAAPKGWDKPGEHVIVDSDSTTRYVILKEGGEKVLHPVLNYASAKLLLEKGKGTVIEVPAKEIDKSKIRHGPTIGIPYAPDRLPSEEDAAEPKTWAVCERPAKGGATPDRAVFVLDKEDAKAVSGKGKVDSGEVLYVEEPKTKLRFLVDGEGRVFRLGTNAVNADPTLRNTLLAATIGSKNKPQPVSPEWLKTLDDSGTISFPEIPDVGSATSVQGLPQNAGTIGQVLKAVDAQGENFYVVLGDRVASISEFEASLITNSPSAQGSMAEAISVTNQDVSTANGGAAQPLEGHEDWPQKTPKQANAVDPTTGADNNTSCSLFDGSFDKEAKKPNLGAWAGKAYPRKVMTDSLNAYVSSGSGLLFREIKVSAAGGGGTYLLTDTGLRYSLPVGNDNASDKTGDKGNGAKKGEQPSETDKARTRLGYEKVKDEVFVPENWAQFIPKGPMLDTGSAEQAQSQ